MLTSLNCDLSNPFTIVLMNENRPRGSSEAALTGMTGVEPCIGHSLLCYRCTTSQCSEKGPCFHDPFTCRRRWDLNPRSAINALRDFESRLFDLLSTSPCMSTRMIRENKLFSCSGNRIENCQPTVGLRAGPIPREPVRRKDFREAARDEGTRISSHASSTS